MILRNFYSRRMKTKRDLKVSLFLITLSTLLFLLLNTQNYTVAKGTFSYRNLVLTTLGLILVLCLALVAKKIIVGGDFNNHGSRTRTILKGGKSTSEETTNFKAPLEDVHLEPIFGIQESLSSKPVNLYSTYPLFPNVKSVIEGLTLGTLGAVLGHGYMRLNWDCVSLGACRPPIDSPG